MRFNYFILIALCFLLTVGVFAQGGLSVKISGTKSFYSAEDPVNLTVTMQNTSSQSVKVLRYLTPINGIDDEILSVSLYGRSMEYIGRDIRRLPPTEEDYVVLLPQETVSGIVTLLDNYDISETGSYAVQFNAGIFTKKSVSGERQQLLTVNSNTVYLDIQGREPPIDPEEVEEDRGETVESRGGGFENKFRSCSSSEKADLIRARNNAMTYSLGSHNYLVAGIVDNRYTDWFGVFNQNRYNGLTEDFRKLSEAMNGEKFVFKCRQNGCGGGAVAWVRRKREFKIHVCNAFFALPDLGYFSQADTIVHEVSHFKDVADTDDHVYGVTNSQQLAINNPNNAANNADNFAFFSVDAGTPTDPCFGQTGFCGQYRAHVANLGWLNEVGDLGIAGTTGQSRRMEAAQITVSNLPSGTTIRSRAHVAGLGWLGWVGNGATTGTTGQSRRMEAIQIEFMNAPSNCTVSYRAHVAGLGWLGWVGNGATAGTTGQSRRMEALQIDFQCP